MYKDTIVSVIMAAYNSEPFIGEAVDSIIKQSLPEFELIIINDNSSDNTLKIIESYNDPRIKVVSNETNRGPSYSRNKAIRLSKGKYIAIMDSDDVSISDRLEKQVSFLNKNKNIMAVGSFIEEIDQDGKKLAYVKSPIKNEQIKSSILFRIPMIHSSTMIRRDFFEENNLFYNESFSCAQDYEMMCRLVFIADVYNIPEPLVLYRWSDNQISTKKKNLQDQYVKKIQSEIISKLNIKVTDEIITIHSKFTTLDKFDTGKDKVENILKWATLLYKKNKEEKIFDNKAFASELLLRFLRFCKFNDISFFKTLIYQIRLHINMNKFYFPYLLIFKRRVRRYS